MQAWFLKLRWLRIRENQDLWPAGSLGSVELVLRNKPNNFFLNNLHEKQGRKTSAQDGAELTYLSAQFNDDSIHSVKHGPGHNAKCSWSTSRPESGFQSVRMIAQTIMLWIDLGHQRVSQPIPD